MSAETPPRTLQVLPASDSQSQAAATVGAWPGGPAVGFASLRFRGAGAYAHLDLEGDSITLPAGARGTWTVVYQASAWPVQPGGGIMIWKWGPKFVFGMGLQCADPAWPDYCSAHVEARTGREVRARVDLTDLTPQYKRYRQATRARRSPAGLRRGCVLRRRRHFGRRAAHRGARLHCAGCRH